MFFSSDISVTQGYIIDSLKFKTKYLKYTNKIIPQFFQIQITLTTSSYLLLNKLIYLLILTQKIFKKL